MAIPTDQQLATEAQYALLEPPNGGASWPSGLWTVTEVWAAFTQAQNEYLRDTACLLTAVTLPSIPMVTRHLLPADWIVTQRVAWIGSDGTIREIPRSDDVEADLGIPEWESQGAPKPRLWTDTTEPTLQLQTMPGANDAGNLHLLYVALGAALTGAGVPLTVPEDATPYVKWRAIGILLEKLGRATDAEAAQYCRQRYQEGVAAMQVVLGGWV